MRGNGERPLAVVCGTAPPRERFLFRDLLALRSHGWEVRCFGLDGRVWSVGDDEHPPSGTMRGGIAPSFLPRLIRRALRHPAPFRLRLALLRRSGLVRAISDFVRDGGLVLAEFAWLTSDVAEEAAREAERPWCCFVHAWDVFTRPRAELSARLRGAASVAACSEAAAEKAGEALGREITVIHHGLNLSEWKFRPDRPDRLRVCAVGRLEPKKGFDRLLSAWPSVLRRVPDACLDIAGEGGERPRLEALALPDGHVRFVGALDEEGVRRLLAESSVLVLPSRRLPDGDRDGIANVLLEAMALGTPVVTTDAGAAGEAVVDGVTGTLLPSEAGDSELAEAMIALLEDARRREGLARAARRVVEEQFDVGQTVVRLSAWLEGCLPAERG